MILLEITTSKGKHSFDCNDSVAFMLEELVRKLKDKNQYPECASRLNSVWYYMGEKINEIKVTFDE